MDEHTDAAGGGRRPGGAGSPNPRAGRPRTAFYGRTNAARAAAPAEIARQFRACREIAARRGAVAFFDAPPGVPGPQAESARRPGPRRERRGGTAALTAFYYDLAGPVGEAAVLAVAGAGGPPRRDGGWDGLLAALRAPGGGFDAVVCSSADRLGRRPERLNLLLGLAADRRVAVLCADLVGLGAAGPPDDRHFARNAGEPETGKGRPELRAAGGASPMATASTA
jgi:hypothetical protein